MPKHRRPASADVAAREWVESLGLQLPTAPDSDEFPTLPEDLTDEDDRAIINLFSKFVAWHNFVESKVSLLEIAEAEIKSKVNYEGVLAEVEGIPSEYKSYTPVRLLTKASRDTDDVVLELEREQREIQGRIKLLKTMANTLERNASLVSRELTRRVSMEDVRRREGRWTT